MLFRSLTAFRTLGDDNAPGPRFRFQSETIEENRFEDRVARYRWPRRITRGTVLPQTELDNSLRSVSYNSTGGNDREKGTSTGRQRPPTLQCGGEGEDSPPAPAGTNAGFGPVRAVANSPHAVLSVAARVLRERHRRFERRDGAPHKRLEKKVESMQAKLRQKDEVIAEIMQAHVELKKVLGNYDRRLGSP